MMFGREKDGGAQESDAGREYRAQLVEDLTWEVVPLKSVDAAIAALPPESSVSVTCSPVKGIDATIELTDRIAELGHIPIPHIAARLVESKAHTQRIAKWMKDRHYRTLFLVGGDAETATHYDEAKTFLADFLDCDHGVTTIGVTSYPDGHALIDSDVLHNALHAKQALLSEAGIKGFASTQMCFDAEKIYDWIKAERQSGLTLPIQLGVPGAINQAKLLSMGVRLGIGASLRYLRKNKSTVSRLVSPGGYDANELLIPMSSELEELDVTHLHCFTFNQVAATEEWRQATLAELDQ